MLSGVSEPSSSVRAENPTWSPEEPCDALRTGAAWQQRRCLQADLHAGSPPNDLWEALRACPNPNPESADALRLGCGGRTASAAPARPEAYPVASALEGCLGC